MPARVLDSPGCSVDPAGRGPASEALPDAAQRAILAVYAEPDAAQAAVQQLDQSGFDMHGASVVGPNYPAGQDALGAPGAGEGMQVWDQRCAFWGGLWGLMFGSGFFVVPGLGPLFAAGPLVGWIVAAVDAASHVRDRTVVGAALHSVGIPTESVTRYEDRLRAGHFVVMAHSAEPALATVRATLESTQHVDLAEHGFTAPAPASAIPCTPPRSWSPLAQLGRLA